MKGFTKSGTVMLLMNVPRSWKSSSAPEHLVIEHSAWHVRRESNPQPAVLETAALPIELLT
jgi:hypothetical protein